MAKKNKTKYKLVIIREIVETKEYNMTQAEYNKYFSARSNNSNEPANNFVADTGTVTKRIITPIKVLVLEEK